MKLLHYLPFQVEQDYEILYPNHNQLYTQWPALSACILKYAEITQPSAGSWKSDLRIPDDSATISEGLCFLNYQNGPCNGLNCTISNCKPLLKGYGHPDQICHDRYSKEIPKFTTIIVWHEKNLGVFRFCSDSSGFCSRKPWHAQYALCLASSLYTHSFLKNFTWAMMELGYLP